MFSNKALSFIPGINFFWNRIHGLLDEMLTLDMRHYAATLLHPKYRSLKMCNETERSECHSYVRQRIKTIQIEQIESIEQQSNRPIVKRFKSDVFSRCESNTFDNDDEVGGESGNESEEYPLVPKKTDEFDRYLTLDLEKSKIDPNPLSFWNDHKQKYPRLSRLARSIFSIPATSAGVER